MRNGIQTDHKFELSPYCACADCNCFCHYHYGQDDACILERYMHQPPTENLQKKLIKEND